MYKIFVANDCTDCMVMFKLYGLMTQFVSLFLLLAISNINFIGCLPTVNVIVNNK